DDLVDRPDDAVDRGDVLLRGGGSLTHGKTAAGSWRLAYRSRPESPRRPRIAPRRDSPGPCPDVEFEDGPLHDRYAPVPAPRVPRAGPRAGGHVRLLR